MITYFPFNSSTNLQEKHDHILLTTLYNLFSHSNSKTPKQAPALVLSP